VFGAPPWFASRPQLWPALAEEPPAFDVPPLAPAVLPSLLDEPSVGRSHSFSRPSDGLNAARAAGHGVAPEARAELADIPVVSA